jgi:hypothetical protein
MFSHFTGLACLRRMVAAACKDFGEGKGKLDANAPTWGRLIVCLEPKAWPHGVDLIATRGARSNYQGPVTAMKIVCQKETNAAASEQEAGLHKMHRNVSGASMDPAPSEMTACMPLPVQISRISFLLRLDAVRIQFCTEHAA